MQALKLQQNNSMKKSIHNAINRGLPVYAECGGLMYLANRIKFGKSLTKMCNVFDIDIEMNERPVGRGYTILDTDKHPWAMKNKNCLLYTSPSPRDPKTSRMPSSA